MNFLKKIRSLFDSLRGVTQVIQQGEPALVSREVYLKRLQICALCPKYNNADMVCLECGCYLEIKGKLNGVECPMGNW